MNNFSFSYFQIYFPSDVVPLVLSVEIPVHIHFDTVSSTKVSRMHAGVENHQGGFSLLNLWLAVKIYSDQSHEIGEWLWLCPQPSQTVET